METNKDARITFVLKDGGIYYIYGDQLKYWQRLYPNIKVKEELEMLSEQMDIGTKKKQTSKGILRYINRYLNSLNASF